MHCYNTTDTGVISALQTNDLSTINSTFKRVGTTFNDVSSEASKFRPLSSEVRLVERE